jgi:hypothetical protein
MLRMLKRMIQVGACAAVLVVTMRPAHSAPAACVNAWRNGDNLVKVGKLRAAKTSMLKCAHYTCGSNLAKECSRRVVEIEGDIPTIVPVVKDESGEAITEIDMVMDGEVLVNRIDGKAVMVDPGAHEFTFRTSRGYVLGSYKTVILQGQRNRTVEVTLRSEGEMPLVKTRVPPGALVAASMPQNNGGRRVGTPELNLVPDEEEEGGRRLTTGTLAMAGIGALGVAGYALASYTGNRENRALNDCTPMCNPAAVDRVQKLYQGGKIALGVGVAALLGASYLYLTSAPKPVEMALDASKLRLDLLPTTQGGMAGISGSF